MQALTILIVTAVIITQVLGYLIKVPSKPAATPLVTDRSQWVHLQKLMIPLFENVCDKSENSSIYKLAEDFNFDRTDYLKPEVVTDLENLISTGLLPRGVIFSEYNADHLKQLKIIYEVLYNAKSFDIFYTAAAWIRQNINCGLYVNALYMAVQNRKDTERLSIPAPYELLPNYFIDQYVIIQSSKIFEKDNSDYVVPAESIHSEGDSYIIDANYTSLFYDNDGDSKLAYFREDIGLNSFYYLSKLNMAPWLNNDINSSFGENTFHMMKQLMARYNLERYANELPEEDDFDWNDLINIPYDPMLLYSNGAEFGLRTSSFKLTENEDLMHLKTIESNIPAIVDHLYQRGYNKTQILNHLIEIMVTDSRSYEALSKQLLGMDLINKGCTSVLDHYMTSLRDPIFWKINTKIVNIIYDALKILPTYTKNELLFPGVEIVNIDVKKMITIFDYFTFDVTDALKIEETNFRIKIGQPRLNHKQFAIKVNISSMVSQKGIMKIYLGPELVPGELVTKRNLFVLLDTCEINLKIGSNMITRTPADMDHFSQDFMLLNTIRKKVEYAEFGLDSFTFKTIKQQSGFPLRLILPKGRTQGLSLQIFVFIAPYVKASFDESYSTNNINFNSAVLSPGYPLDLIRDRQLFELPNSMIRHVIVTQKGENKVENYGGPGVTKSWYSTNTYDSSARPNYNSKSKQFGSKSENSDVNYENNVFESHQQNLDNNLHLASRLDYSSKKEPFDYQAKKAQYNNNSVKRNFSKYHTTTKNEDDVVVSTISNNTEKYVINYNSDVLPSNRITKGNKMYIAEVNTEDILRQDSYLEVEPLPMPSMLKKDPKTEKYNYKAKKTERDYKIKEKKVELNQLIKDAKMKSKNKKHDKNSEFSETTTNLQENVEKDIFFDIDEINNINDNNQDSAEDDVASTISSNTEKYILDYNSNIPSSDRITKENEMYNAEVNTEGILPQDNYLEVEPLSTPSMLKKGAISIYNCMLYIFDLFKSTDVFE